VAWSIISAAACEMIDHIVVSSDIESLQRYETKFPHLSYHQRPDLLCLDDSTDYDVIHDVMSVMGSAWDLIVYLRPTTPFRADYHLCEAIKSMSGDGNGATGLRSVEEMGESAFKCFTMPTPFLTPITSGNLDMTDWPNQKVTKSFKANGYIDIARPEILKRGQLWGNWVAGYVTPRTIEIDTPEDWEYAEWYANRSVDAPLRFGRRSV